MYVYMCIYIYIHMNIGRRLISRGIQEYVRSFPAFTTRRQSEGSRGEESNRYTSIQNPHHFQRGKKTNYLLKINHILLRNGALCFDLISDLAQGLMELYVSHDLLVLAIKDDPRQCFDRRALSFFVVIVDLQEDIVSVHLGEIPLEHFQPFGKTSPFLRRGVDKGFITLDRFRDRSGIVSVTSAHPIQQ